LETSVVKLIITLGDKKTNRKWEEEVNPQKITAEPAITDYRESADDARLPLAHKFRYVDY